MRGLITCGQCGSAYVGQVFTFRSGNQGAYYRCCGRSPDHYARQNKCRARVVNALWLERLVWEDCRTFICTPGEVLAEAQRQLHDRMRQVAHMDQERGHYVQALAEKTQERDRVMTLFRRGRIALRDAEAKLDDITREAVDYYRTTVCPHTSTTLCIAADRDNRLYTSVYRMCAQPKILGSILIDIAACLLHSCPCVAVTTEDDL